MKEGDNAPADGRGKHANRPNAVSEDIRSAIRAHIRSFPTYESHYTRNQHPTLRYLEQGLTVAQMFRLFVEKLASENEPCCHEWIYQYIFYKEFIYLKLGKP